MTTESQGTHDVMLVLFSRFQPITLSEFDAISLLKQKKEKKFVFHLNQLPALLEKLQPHFNILEIEGKRINRYDTTYFDTSDYSMYHDHHNKRPNRYKIRIINYKITNDSFLEIKFKSIKGVTIKNLIPVDCNSGNILSINSDFIKTNSPYSPDNLKLALNNSFYRMTFADRAMTQILTIDTGLFFSNYHNERSLENIVIAKLNQSTVKFSAHVLNILKEMNIQSYKISKYCIGLALLSKEVKHNRFKTHLQSIEKMCKESII